MSFVGIMLTVVLYKWTIAQVVVVLVVVGGFVGVIIISFRTCWRRPVKKNEETKTSAATHTSDGPETQTSETPETNGGVQTLETDGGVRTPETQSSDGSGQSLQEVVVQHVPTPPPKRVKTPATDRVLRSATLMRRKQ